MESNGNVIQQGFATNEVYTYENDLTGWKKQVDFFLIHWFGYENYPAMLSLWITSMPTVSASPCSSPSCSVHGSTSSPTQRT